MIATGTQPLSGQRILVVDDEESIVDAVATALRYEGFEVEEAANGRDALASVMRAEPDLLVLDWMLPDIDGIAVGRRLRADGNRAAVLFLTAKAVHSANRTASAKNGCWRWSVSTATSR